MPDFRSRADAELTKKIYSHVPILWKEAVTGAHGDAVNPDANPWVLAFKQGLFNMTSDSGLFLEAPGPTRLPLYEGKLIYQFDHRWAIYAPATGGEPESRDATEAEKADPDFTVRPRYWVETRQVLARIAAVPREVAKAYAGSDDPLAARLVAAWIVGSVLEAGGSSKAAWDRVAEASPWLAAIHQDTKLELIGREIARRNGSFNEHTIRFGRSEIDIGSGMAAFMDALSPRWFMGWRDISLRSVERTVIATVLPRSAIGHTLPVFVFSAISVRISCVLYGLLDSIVLDYIARLKVGGTHLTYSYLKQFAVLPPSAFAPADIAFLVPRVLELTYTAHDLRPLYDDVIAEDSAYDPRPPSEHGRPFAWDPDRRALLRAELDAYYAKLYGLTRDELRYILDPKDVMGPDYPSETFRVLAQNEQRRFGEYRTRRLVLEAWDRLMGSS